MAAYPSHPLPRTDLTAHSTLLTNASSAHPAQPPCPGASPDNRSCLPHRPWPYPPQRHWPSWPVWGCCPCPPIAPVARMDLVASSPSITGHAYIHEHSGKISGPSGPFQTGPAASWPSSAVSTSMPRISRRVLAISRFSSLSSASSTRQWPEKSSRSFSAPFSSDPVQLHRANASYMVLPNRRLWI